MNSKKNIVRPKKLSVSAPAIDSTYEKDFYKWTGTQAKLLRRGDFKKIDIDNLIEEIESLGKSDKRALKSHLINLLTHLLKIEYQPESRGNSNSWNASVKNARLEILLIMEDSPSLKKELTKMIEGAYNLARQNAAGETNLPLDKFPEKCPWANTEILNS